MRRAASILTVLLAVTLVASVAMASTANYKDRFSNAGYSGSDGSLSWSSDPWKEIGDDGSHKTGKVQSLASGNCPGGNNCLAILGQSLNLVGVGASRPADLGSFQSATLNYKLRFVVDDLVTAAFLHVEGRTGGAWAPLRTPHVINNGSVQDSIGLPGLYLDDGFELRFVVNGLLAGDVYIDDVEISGVLNESTTTSTTTTSSSSTTSSTSTSTTLPITTTLPTITTTTLPGLLTTSTSTTTTTSEGPTTTEGEGATTTSTTSGTSAGSQSGGSSGDGTTPSTSTGQATTAGQSDPDSPAGSSPAPGLREASIGLQAGFDSGRFGNVDQEGLDVLGVAIEPNYSTAVEVFESSWVYLLVLILLIATAIVGGLDRRRLKRAKHTDI